MSLSPTSAVVEAGGVGFDLRIPLSTYERLKGKTESCLYTHLHVREDDLRLFGFATLEERDFFRLIQSVGGVGPSIALAALCALSPAEVARAVVGSDHKTLQKIKGVGRKLAERLVLELRDRVGDLALRLGMKDVSHRPGDLSKGGSRPPGHLPADSDAILALVGLGYERREAEARVEEARTALLGSRPPQTDVESIIKWCLRSS